MQNQILYLVLFVFFTGCLPDDTINVLILSGSNNHNWQETTPFLENLYRENGFSVATTLRPDTLTAEDLKDCDVLVNNWNSWPDTEKRWPRETENALLQFIQSGGGWVTFHASSSAFYSWPEFRNISTASWEKNTRHGPPDTVSVIIENHNHPVTRDMHNFTLVDELWIDARANDRFTVLAVATDKALTENDSPAQPAVLVTEYGKGRIFHTILGHDTTAMQNRGFKELMLRGTVWAATGKGIYQSSK